MQETTYICENCGCIHNGTYGSGRFCGSKCAHSYPTKANRNEISNKVSAKLQGRRVGSAVYKSQESLDKWRKSYTKTINERRLIRQSMPDYKIYKTAKGVELNITREELKQYRQIVTVCEICGKAETHITPKKKQQTPNNLCVDHDHSTNKFRGLLCNKCNSRLGWFENHQDIIMNYIRRGK